eukprot:CFRG3352T1
MSEKLTSLFQSLRQDAVHPHTIHTQRASSIVEVESSTRKSTIDVSSAFDGLDDDDDLDEFLDDPEVLALLDGTQPAPMNELSTHMNVPTPTSAADHSIQAPFAKFENQTIYTASIVNSQKENICPDTAKSMRPILSNSSDTTQFLAKSRNASDHLSTRHPHALSTPTTPQVHIFTPGSVLESYASIPTSKLSVSRNWRTSAGKPTTTTSSMPVLPASAPNRENLSIPNITNSSKLQSHVQHRQLPADGINRRSIHSHSTHEIHLENSREISVRKPYRTQHILRESNTASCDSGDLTHTHIHLRGDGKNIPSKDTVVYHNDVNDTGSSMESSKESIATKRSDHHLNKREYVKSSRQTQRTGERPTGHASSSMFSQNSEVCYSAELPLPSTQAMPQPPMLANSQSTQLGRREGSAAALAVKRKFPGPAGMLPPLTSGLTIDDIIQTSPRGDRKRLAKAKGERLSLCANPEAYDNSPLSIDYNKDPGGWVAMLNNKSLRSKYRAFCEGDRLALKGTILAVSIHYILDQSALCKIPHLAVMVQTLAAAGSGKCTMFKDPTGEMPGEIHRKVLARYADLKIGAVLVLKNVSVFYPKPTDCYLNITLNNIERVFSDAGEDMTAQTSHDERGTHSGVSVKQRILQRQLLNTEQLSQ